ncbi:MAG: NAD(P)H-binding protein, partial [Gemmatimonadales bacterium]|nr:NAD(P)H-binding protein [Gemmatimonadales bacterium]
MKALVTGATGFVGSHLVDRLLGAGDAVTALVRSPAKAAGLAQRGVTLVPGDLHDRDALARAARGQDVAYHVAALVGAVDEAEFLRANREGTANVVQALEAEAPAARLVLVSSLAAAGPAPRGAPRGVEAPEAPVTMYGRSKLASEAVVRASGLGWVIARPPAVY